MERLDSVAANEQSHCAKLETVTQGNCSPTKSSANGQSVRESTTNPDRLHDASASFANKVSSEQCCSDRTAVGSPQKVSRQTSELSLGTDFIQTDSHARTSRADGSVLLHNPSCRPIPYNFASTRHESYGNLGISSLAGLSSTSATLALLPLQASGQSRTTTQPSLPVTTSSVTTSPPPLYKTASSSGTTSLDLPSVGHGGKLGGATTNIAASVKDRRSTFFSEPPKPISLPTRSASQLSSLCDESLGSGSQPPTNVSSPGSKDSDGLSLSVTSVPHSISGSFTNLSTAATLETHSSALSSLQQQPAVTAESWQLCRDVPHAVSAQCDILSSDQSAAPMSDSDDTHFSIWCGPPPDNAAASEPASTVDPFMFEMGTFFLVMLNLFPNSSINVVALRWGRLVLGCVTICRYTILIFNPATLANSAWPSLCG